MRYYGIHVHHDAAIAILAEDGTLEFYGPSERYVRVRHCEGYLKEMVDAFPGYVEPRPGDVVSWVRGDSYEAPNDPIANDSQFRQWSTRSGEGVVVTRDLPHYGPLVAREYDVSGGLRLLCLDHHAAHAAAAWCFRPDDRERLFITADGGGLNVDNVQLFSVAGTISGSSFAVEELDCVPSSYPIERVFGGLNYKAGALMGLAGHRPDAPHHSRDWLSRGEGVAGQPLSSSNLTAEQMDLCAGFYRYYMELIAAAVFDVIERKAAGRGLVYGGGTALALDLNSRLSRRLGGDFVFGPPTDDSGLALGAAALAFFHDKGRWPEALTSPSLVALQAPLPDVGPGTPREIARVLSSGAVVGLLRGQAEVGPRALGYRSLLAPARSPDMLRRVSVEIKGRESYRPLAPIVTDREFQRFFTGPPGHFMQFRVDCTDEARELLPAIVHTDGSARPQVVSERDDPYMYELLVEYGKLSGAECLINTSLNRGGKPICNTFEDAKRDFEGYPVVLASVATPAHRFAC